LPKPQTAACASQSTQPSRNTSVRTCFFSDGDPVKTPIYKAVSLARNSKIRGPAIIEEPTTTLVVYPDTAVTVSSAGNYLLETT
jgi:N-methylhydantoinase A